MGKISNAGRFCVVVLSAAVVLTLTAIISPGVSLTVSGQERNKLPESYYTALEKDMTDGVRAYLDANGYKNSGIMLTHTTDPEENRVYTLKVHHKKIVRLSDIEKDKLATALAAYDFEADGVSFRHEFLLE